MILSLVVDVIFSLNIRKDHFCYWKCWILVLLSILCPSRGNLLGTWLRAIDFWWYQHNVRIIFKIAYTLHQNTYYKFMIISWWSDHMRQDILVQWFLKHILSLQLVWDTKLLFVIMHDAEMSNVMTLSAIRMEILTCMHSRSVKK